MKKEPPWKCWLFCTRPEAIKWHLYARFINDDSFEAKVCVTAQHREMLDQVLNLLRSNQITISILWTRTRFLTDITCRILEGLKPVLASFQPDVVFGTWWYNNDHGSKFSRILSTNSCWSWKLDYVLAIFIPLGLKRQTVLLQGILQCIISPTETAKLNLVMRSGCG